MQYRMTATTTKANDSLLAAAQDDIRAEMNAIADSLSVGGCQDYAEYKYYTGIIYGLAVAERALLDIDRRNSQD